MGLFDFFKSKESAKIKSYWDNIEGVSSVENLYVVDDTDSGIISMSISNDGNKIAAGIGYNDKIILMDLANKHTKSITTSGRINTIHFSADDKYIAWGSSDKNINVMNLISGEIVHNERLHSDGVEDIKISSNNKYLVAVSEDGLILEYFLGKFIFESYNDSIYAIAFSPDERFMLLGLKNDILFFDLSNPQQFNNYNQQNGTSLRYARLWTILAPAKYYQGHSANVTSIVFSPSGKTFLSGDTNGVINLWDTKRKVISKKFKKTSLPINSLCFTKDGYYFLSASGNSYLIKQANDDPMIKLWKITNDEPIFEFSEHKNAVVFAGFDKDNNIISASVDGSIKKIII